MLYKLFYVVVLFESIQQILPIYVCMLYECYTKYVICMLYEVCYMNVILSTLYVCYMKYVI